MEPLLIRKVEARDVSRVREIFLSVVREGDTYVFPPDLPAEEVDRHWLAPGMHTWVAETGGEVAGTYMLKPNQIGRGDHVANGSFMVARACRGRGIGRALAEHALKEARRLGFEAMQFNLVVATNTAAIHLWHTLGFELVGTLPRAFRHPEQGRVDAHIFYKLLEPPPANG